MKTKTSAKPEKARVVIVDDHPIVREGVSRLLASQDDLVVCGEADNAESALNVIAKAKPQLVIVDVSLRGANGIELVKNIRALHPKLPVLVFSVMEESLFALRALRAGSLGYVSKHQTSAELLRAIRMGLEGKICVSDKIAKRLLRDAAGQANDGAGDLHRLTDRELEVLEWIGRGRSTREIAHQLHFSSKTIEAFRSSIKRKLKLASAAELVHYATRWLQNQGVS